MTDIIGEVGRFGNLLGMMARNREMRQKMPRQRPDDLISASEIASFAFCPEAWRLEYGLGLPAANQAARRAGVTHHARKATAERVAGGAIAVGLVVAMIALLGLLLLIWLPR
jgi:hypothetical protein